MADETKKDVSKQFRTGVETAGIVGETAFDKIDQKAKNISKSISEESDELNRKIDEIVGTSNNLNDFVSSKLKTATNENDDTTNAASDTVNKNGKTNIKTYSNNKTKVTDDTTINISDDVFTNIKTFSDQELSETNEDKKTSNIKTLAGNQNDENITHTSTQSSNIKTSVIPSKTEEFKEDDESSVNWSKIKTLAATYINKKTFDFQVEQRKISKTITVTSKTGKVVSKAGKKVARTSEKLRRAFDEEDGSGAEYIQHSATKYATRKLGKPILKYAGKGIFNIGKVITRAFVGLLKGLLGVLTSAVSFAPVLVCILGAVAFLMLIFGTTASDTGIGKYENYMLSVQKEYDRQVDEWIKENPNGVVIGVQGDYGRIDWRVPLSIIQATGAELEFDFTEIGLLNTFQKAGLYEQHIESEQEVTVVNDAGKEEVETIKVLTITNAGYEDYMSWSKKNWSNMVSFMVMKDVYKNGQNFYTDSQLEVIDSLYTSDSFYDLFSEMFQEHQTITGSNASENNFTSPEYESLNIFTQAGFKGQCTWYAYGRALKVTGKKMPSGDAQTWPHSAIAMGYPTGTRPSKNAVVVLSGNNFGHVAFVEAWDGKTITVSEGNYNNPYANTNQMVEYAREHAVELVHEEKYESYEAYRKKQETFGLTVVGFIYLE